MAGSDDRGSGDADDRRALTDLTETAAETIRVLREANDRLSEDARDASEAAAQAAFWRQVAIELGASPDSYDKHMEAMADGKR